MKAAVILTTLFLIAFIGCGGGENHEEAGEDGTPPATSTPGGDAGAKPEGETAVGPDGPADLALPATIASIPTDPESITKGEAVFNAKGCGACHAFGSKLVGPDLTGVGERRTTPWIARMLRHPEQMTKKDPVARELFKTHMVQMTNQGVSDEDLPLLIAFLQSKKAN